VDMGKLDIILWIGFALYVWVCYYLVAGLYGF